MNEKIYRIIVITLAVLLVTTLTGSRWLYARSDRQIEGLELEARNHLSLLESYGSGLSYVSGQYIKSETGRVELDRRNRELEKSLSDFAKRFGDLDGGLYGIESEIGKTRAGLRDDINSLSGLIAEIGESIERSEDIQNGYLESGSDSHVVTNPLSGVGSD